MSNDYQDGGHRPHARHTGEVPRNEIKEAPYHLSVTLDTWGPVDNLFPAIYDALQSNWGDEPSRSVRQNQPNEAADLNHQGDVFWARTTGWERLSEEQQAYVESCFAKKTLQQVLERITFSFLIDGCTRACTHQLVRTRIGAGMMQHGGRDNDWRHRPWVMPETIRRACEVHTVLGKDEVEFDDTGNVRLPPDLKHCITDWDPIYHFMDSITGGESERSTLQIEISEYLDRGRNLYAALVDAGIPWEDARRLLWMGTATYIHIDYNYLGLAGVMGNRLEHIMDWEINCVAQLMLRELKMKCPPLLSKYLGSHSDLAGKDMFAGLQSWPPVGKYPNPYERCECGHPKANHDYMNLDGSPGAQGMTCLVCYREHIEPLCTQYRPVDALPREHRPEQNPFWVLHPDSMAGGPVVWVPTNGVYPHQRLSDDQFRLERDIE